MYDPYFSNVVLLLPCDGTDGSTSFPDRSNSAHTVTAAGNAQVDTAQSKFGGASALFDGSGDYLSVADHSDFELGAGDFCFRAWVRLSGYSPGFGGFYRAAVAGKYTSSERGFYWAFTGTSSSWTGMLFLSNDGTVTSVSGSFTFSLDTWYHVAVSRESGNARLWVNGQQIGSTTTLPSIPDTVHDFRVGAIGYSGYEYYLPGWIDDFELTKGIARYTDAFTPPGELWLSEGVLVGVEAVDGLSASGETGIVGALVSTDATDIAAGAGEIDRHGDLSAAESADAVAAAGILTTDYSSPHASALGLLCVSAHTVYSRGVLSSAHTTRLPWGLQRGHTTAWDIQQALSSAHATACRLADSLSSGHRARWDIAWDDGTLTSAHANYWDLGSWAPVATPAPVICTVGGVVVDVASLSIGQENGAQWSADIKLADPADLDRFAIDALFTLQVGGQTWSLWVDRRTLARTGGDVQGGATREAGIFALGAPVGLDHPRAAPITKTWAVPIMASAAVAELLGSVDWAMVDWSIPPDRLAVVDASPLAAARSVVQAAGGVLEMSPDGSIRARPEYPITLPDWAGATPDHIITEIDSIFGLDEQLAVEQLVDSVRVYDADAAELGSGGDRLEFQADEADGLWGTVTAYPSPWREVTLRTSAGGRVGIGSRGSSSRAETEVVEIVEGAGNVGFPMSGISSLTWITDSLGGISWTPQGTQIKAASAGYSLVSLTYITSFYYWRVYANQSTPAQFILEDSGEGGSPAGIIDVTCVRGDGTHPGPDVLDSLLGSEAAAVARGRRELDAGALHSLVALTCPFLPAVRAGHLVEIAESRNATWRGMVSGVRHERSGPLPSTTLQIIRAL